MSNVKSLACTRAFVHKWCQKNPKSLCDKTQVKNTNHICILVYLQPKISKFQLFLDKSRLGVFLNNFLIIDSLCAGAAALLFIHSKPNFHFLLLFSFLLLIMRSRIMQQSQIANKRLGMLIHNSLYLLKYLCTFFS